MNCLNNSFVFDSRIVSEFQEKGYVKMPRFLSTQFTAYLKNNQNKGFPWHIETQSFAYQHAGDYAMTVWVPLENIDTQKQRGGMAYVPKHKLSGDPAYAYIDPAVFELLEGRISSGSPITIEEFMELRDGPLNSPA